MNLAIDLHELGDHAVAAHAYAALDRNFGDTADPQIRFRAVRRRVNLGVVQSRDMHESMRVIGTHDDIAARCRASTSVCSSGSGT